MCSCLCVYRSAIVAVSKLLIHQFRNIESANVEFNPKTNIIYGDNGSGKTSLLEALCFIGLGRSFRTHLTSRVVHHQHKEFILYSELSDDFKTIPIGLQKSKNGDTILKIDGAQYQKLSTLLHHLPLQIITPESVDLLSGSPKNRRAFVDWGVFYHDVLFYANWVRIKRLLKQRNAALKQCKTYKELQMWDNELCFLSDKISTQRQVYFDLLVPIINEMIADFLPSVEVSCKLYYGWDPKNKPLSAYFEDNFSRELLLGYTTVGPQKADVRFKVDGFPIADVLSRGQLKLFVYALRLAQGVFLNSLDRKQCVFLIDDFSSELDSNKQAILAKHIKKSDAQLFITAIKKQSIDHLFQEDSSVFHVKQGVITKQ
ncbi:MAG TPA: DNA replication/repair protein RecF [Leucothrix mucor]|nr:DNA replication/repair protein RecF [Leucothrix mucor]